MHPVDVHYRKRLEEAAGMAPEEADYHALDMGPASTQTRYRLLVDAFGAKLCGTILDLGCGTAAVLDTIVDYGLKPVAYHGVDGLAERQEPVLARLQRHGLAGGFTHKPMHVRFEDLVFMKVDVAMLVGVVGYWGYHTQRQLKSIYTYMRACSEHGVITVPKIFDANQMGDCHVRRWDPTDVIDLLEIDEGQVLGLPKDFWVVW